MKTFKKIIRIRIVNYIKTFNPISEKPYDLMDRRSTPDVIADLIKKLEAVNIKNLIFASSLNLLRH